MLWKVLGKRSWTAGAIRGGACVALAFSVGAANAAERSSDARYRIEQPARSLAESLRAIAGQTGTSVLFDPVAVNGRVSRAVSGQLTAAEAIAQALEGSGLVPIIMPDGSIVVRPGAAPVPSTAPASAPKAAASPKNAAGTAEPSRVPAAAVVASGDASWSIPRADGATSALTRVEITGSRLKRIDADGPAPVNTYTRADIDRSGQPTLERFISSLNEASIGVGEGAQGTTTGQGAVQLRGLPLGSTLVLINGRRVQAVGSSSGNFFNLNLIPLAAVERVEIVPVGSSAVYGGDALAGVVNIILKKSIEGVSVDVHAAEGRGTGDRSVSLATGERSIDGSFLLLGSYSKTTPLGMAERSFFRDADYRRLGGVDARTRGCTPGTVSSTTTANLPGLSSTFAAIPMQDPGQPLTIASFSSTAGQANLCNSMANGNGAALIYGAETLAVHAAGETRLAADWSVFGEVTFARDRLRSEQGGLLLNNVLVPASNPYNPFGVPVRVTTRLGEINGLETFARSTDFTRTLLGLRGALPAGWDIEASISTTRDDGDRRIGNTTANTSARTAALAATATSSALNPFTTGVAASEEVLRKIWPDSARDNHGRKDQVGAFVRGALVDLPAGSVDLIAGAEWARDRYKTVTPGSFDIASQRSNHAIYSEVRAPLWRSGTEGASWELATLTLAGRRDSYSDFGSANTYQLGAEFRPARTVLLRASLATSFKPPTLLQTRIDETRLTTDAYGLVDPAHSNAPIVGGEVLRVANPDLNPEKGRAVSFGGAWEPQGLAGTRFGATAWRVKIDGLIALLWPQVTLDNEALFPGFVTRSPGPGGTLGQVTRVLYSEVNYGGINTAGIDVEASHSWKAAGLKWTMTANATRTSQYDVVLAPGAAAENRLGRRAVDFWSPRWKGRVFAGLDQSNWSLGLTGRYLGGYNDSTPGGRSLGRFWIYDLAGTVALDRLGLRLPSVKDASLSLAVANVGDRLPEYVGASPYYDVTQADWRGRYASVRLSMHW
ncbi:TonB-dependent receptor domain-containing protein [Roseateles sp. NT4]|uniref:TonB-dependent receptor domain-containing protein n=1 Tax=Roseateles sp. NT4 TaxID=3453715 RepID=UPI003EEAA9F6